MENIEIAFSNLTNRELSETIDLGYLHYGAVKPVQREHRRRVGFANHQIALQNAALARNARQGAAR